MVPVAVAAASVFAVYVTFRGHNTTTTKSIDADDEQEEGIEQVEALTKSDPMIGLPLEDESESPEVTKKTTVESSAAGESQELLPDQNDPTNKPSPQVDTSAPEQSQQPLKSTPKKSKKKKLAKMFSWTKKADKTKKRAAATTPTSSASDTASQSDSLIAGQ